MDVISRLITLTNDMEEDNVYRYVGTTVLQNIRDLPRLSIYALADLCAVSPATVSRFVKLTGFASFSAFKLEVAMEILPGNGAAHPEDGYRPLANPEQYLAACAQTLDRLRAQLTPQRLQTFAERLRSANCVYFLLNENVRTRRLQRRLFIEGKRTLMQGRPNGMQSLLPQMRPGDVLVAKAVSAWETAHKMELLEQAKARGVYTLAVAPEDCTACASADDWLRFPRTHPGIMTMAEQIIFDELAAAYIAQVAE